MPRAASRELRRLGWDRHFSAVSVSPIFTRNAEFGHGRIDALGQFRQLRAALDPDPEYAWSLRRREESVSAHANFERSAFDLPQSFRDGGDLLRRLFSD